MVLITSFNQTSLYWKLLNNWSLKLNNGREDAHGNHPAGTISSADGNEVVFLGQCVGFETTLVIVNVCADFTFHRGDLRHLRLSLIRFAAPCFRSFWFSLSQSLCCHFSTQVKGFSYSAGLVKTRVCRWHSSPSSHLILRPLTTPTCLLHSKLHPAAALLALFYSLYLVHQHPKPVCFTPVFCAHCKLSVMLCWIIFFLLNFIPKNIIQNTKGRQ